MTVRRIGIMTSGGDAPGMNAAVRAALKMALHLGVEVVGIQDGYQGLLEGRTVPLEAHACDGIERRGGTILGTSRSAEFRTAAGLERGLAELERAGVQALLVIGGEGSLTGALTLHRRGFPVVGVPASIDNDVGGTQVAIGVDTAINTAVEAIDKLKDTASAFHRAFVVEVMGRHSGWIALQSAMASGAEMVLVPEVPFDPEEVVDRMRQIKRAGRSHFVLVAAEGINPSATTVSQMISNRPDVEFESRLTILGHIQRGGSPTAFDRLLAARLGAKGVSEMLAGRFGTVVGLINMATVSTPLEDAFCQAKHFNPETYRFAGILAE